jgi:hypothetical protein
MSFTLHRIRDKPRDSDDIGESKTRRGFPAGHGSPVSISRII